jgi:GTP cyclohydrolase II
MRQEGRGIGLYNKLDTYLLQDAGADTFTANRLVGRQADERNYSAAAQMLHALGVLDVRLVTNNPEKLKALSRYGISVHSTVRTGLYLNPGQAPHARPMPPAGKSARATARQAGQVNPPVRSENSRDFMAERAVPHPVRPVRNQETQKAPIGSQASSVTGQHTSADRCFAVQVAAPFLLQPALNGASPRRDRSPSQPRPARGGTP